MIDIVIQYRPVSFYPYTRRRNLLMPSRWTELSDHQLESIHLALSGRTNDNTLISLFLGVSKFFARRLDSYSKFCILRQLTFLNKIDTCDKFIIRRIGNLCAPAARLKDVTFGQFIFGDTYFQNYCDGKRKDLDSFIACYYTRGKFSEKDIDQNTAVISHESIQKREAIALNYRLIREWLARRYTHVFEKSDAKKKDKSNGWVGVFDAVVGDNVIDTDRYADTPLSQMLRYLDNRVAEHLKRK